MVTRDDLADGGAGHIARTIAAIRNICPDVGVELLISDLRGNTDSLKTVLSAGVEVFNHNIETVPRLYPKVRPQANYRRSLDLLSRAAQHIPLTAIKSGLMLGLGETRTELLNALDDLREAGCRLLTLGQYLTPSERHHPVIRYVPPEEFAEYEEEAISRGFKGVASAPYVRSSFQAEKLYNKALDM